MVVSKKIKKFHFETYKPQVIHRSFYYRIILVGVSECFANITQVIALILLPVSTFTMIKSGNTIFLFVLQRYVLSKR